MSFNIGDRVVDRYTIGKVVRITPKRGDIIVDFGNYKDTYSKNGWKKGCDAWDIRYIELLTPELEKEINDNKTINKCLEVVRLLGNKHQLTANQARKILEILANEKEETDEQGRFE